MTLATLPTADASPAPTPTYFAHTRTAQIESVNYLVAQGRHARRRDRTGAARVRQGAIPGTSLGWSLLDGPIPEPRPVHSSHYAAAHRALLRAHGARVRKGAPLGLHLLVNISPGWVTEGGGLHDPANPRIQAHFAAVVDWVRVAFGAEALFAVRIDLDETGGGVADVFVAPLRRLGHKIRSASGHLWVSVNRAMEELTDSTGHLGWENWHAINTSWAAYARQHLDPRLKRGIPAAITGHRHISPDLLRAMHQALDRRADELEVERRAQDEIGAAFARVLRAVLGGWRLEEGVDRTPTLSPPPALPLRGEKDAPDERTLLADLTLVWPSHAPALRAAARLVSRFTEWSPATRFALDAVEPIDQLQETDPAEPQDKPDHDPWAEYEPN